MKNPLIYLLFFALLIPSLALRDFTPSNELRYVGIVGDAMAQHHYFTFYLQGEIYADKPPFFFWLMMLEKLLFGSFSMLALGMLNLIPSFLIVWIMDRWTTKVLSPAERLAASAMLLTTSLYLGVSAFIRMDMLMTLFIVLSLHTFFRIYQNVHQPYEKWLLPIYLFMGMFTKWPVGAVIPILAIGLFLLWKRQLLHAFKYIGIPQILLFLALTATWWLGIYWEGGSEYLDNLLFKQTFGRAIHAYHHKEPIYYYLITMWYSFAPWILLYLVTLFYAVRRRLIETDMEKLFISVVITTFAFMSAMSSKIEIYLLPLYPFLAFFTLLIIKKSPAQAQSRMSVLIPALLFFLALPAFMIFRKSLTLPEHITLWLIAALLALATFAGYSLFRVHTDIYRGIISLAAGMLGCIFIFSFSIPNINGHIGFGKMAEYTRQTAQAHQINSIFYYPFRSGEFLSFYFGKTVEPIKGLNDRGSLPRKPFLLIIKTKEFMNNSEVRIAAQGKIAHYIDGYTIIEWE